MDELEGLRKDWWLYMLLGVGLVILGLLVISTPAITAVAVTTVVGILLIASAIVQGVYAFKFYAKPGRTLLQVFVAILYALAGVALLSRPIIGAVTLTILLAIYFFAKGIVKIVAAFEMRRHLPHWGWMLFGGILSLILGLLIAASWPSSALWAIALLLGIDLMVAGWTIIVLSVSAHAAFGRTQRLAGQH